MIKVLSFLAGVMVLGLAVLIGFVFTNSRMKMENPVAVQEIEPDKKAPRARSKPVETELP